MHLDPFDLHRPTTVEEAVGLADRFAGQFDFLAGGTDLLPNYKMHLNLKPNLIALDGIPELSARSGGRLGAMVRLADLERDAAIAARYPSVAEAAREVATPLVRASGTVGGNLLLETRCFFFNQSHFWRESLGYCLKAEGDRCHVVPQKEKCYATFSGDLAPALMVHDAVAEVADSAGRRKISLADLYDADGDGIHRVRLAPGSLLVAVELPSDGSPVRSTYRKLRVRPAFDFPELGVAASVRWDGDRVGKASVAVGGIETYPRRFDDLAAQLTGTDLDDPSITAVADAVVKRVRPVHNTSLPPDYRKKMTGVYVRRTLAALRPGSGRVAG